MWKTSKCSVVKFKGNHSIHLCKNISKKHRISSVFNLKVMSCCVDEWADLQWCQDDLHAAGAFRHHLFSALLCDTEQNKDDQKCEDKHLRKTTEGLLITAQWRLLFQVQQVVLCMFGRPSKTSHNVTEDFLGTCEDNCPGLFVVKIPPISYHVKYYWLRFSLLA